MATTNVPHQDLSEQSPQARRSNATQTFRVKSLTQPGVIYDVIYVRRKGQRRWFCSCKDFFFRHLASKRPSHCKHLRILVSLAEKAHGVRRLAKQSRLPGREGRGQ